MSENKKNLPVSPEEPVRLLINGEIFTTFMCTPEHLTELALGFLLSQGLITNPGEIITITACKNNRCVEINTANHLSPHGGLKSVLATGCGSGSPLREEFWKKPPLQQKISFDPKELPEIARELFDRAKQQKKTGGMHSCGLAKNSGLILSREDVGRHNAMDKVIGAACYRRLNPESLLALTTGRISSDMVLKAYNFGIPIIASRSIPTSLALKMAQDKNMTLIGRMTRPQPNLYC